MMQKIFIGFPPLNDTQNIKWAKPGLKKSMPHPRNVFHSCCKNFIIRAAMNGVDRLEKIKQPGNIFVRPVMEDVDIHCGYRGSLHNRGKTANQNEFDVRL